MIFGSLVACQYVVWDRNKSSETEHLREEPFLCREPWFPPSGVAIRLFCEVAVVHFMIHNPAI